MLTLQLDGRDYRLSEKAQSDILNTVVEKGYEQFLQKVPKPAQALVEMLIVEEHKKMEVRMMQEGVPVEAIKAARPKKGESYLKMIKERVRPMVEVYVNNATIRLERNDDGEITHLFVEFADKSTPRR